MKFELKLAFASLALAGVSLASAQTHSLGQHPAVLIQRQQSAIDPNTFIVAHPAGLAMQHTHSNHEHPAVAAARLADGQSAIDPNTFTVQPPAATTWTLSPTADTLPKLARLD